MSFKWDRVRRLRDDKAIQRVYNEGTRVKMTGGALFFLPAEEFRGGVSVSRRVGNAVVRNRHKRWVGEILRLRQYSFSQPLWVMVVIYRSYPSLGVLRREIEDALERGERAVCDRC